MLKYELMLFVNQLNTHSNDIDSCAPLTVRLAEKDTLGMGLWLWIRAGLYAEGRHASGKYLMFEVCFNIVLRVT